MVQHLIAWWASSLPFISTAPWLCCIKGNFDVVIQGAVAITVASIIDDAGSIILTTMKKLHGSNALQGEALATLLIIQLAASTGCSSLELEGDTLLEAFL